MFPKLRSLRLADCPITDDSIEHLRQFQSLNYLSIFQTNLTLPGAERLSEAIEMCEIQTSFPK